jgi:hypothetical protein
MQTIIAAHYEPAVVIGEDGQQFTARVRGNSRFQVIENTTDWRGQCFSAPE